MKVAIIHDWLVVNGGAEKVLEQIISIYPKADVFTLVDFLPEENRGWLSGINVFTSFIQKMPFAKRKYRNYFPLFPVAIEQFDLSGYDLVISSSYSVAKGVITGPDQKHITYCHSPARYAWDLQAQYLREAGIEKGVKSILARYFLHRFRIWDVRTIYGVDKYIANSEFIKKRIKKCYGRDALIVYPPVDIDRFCIKEEKDEYYLTASRMVPYKRMDLIVEAYSQMPDKKLKVIGDGPEMEKIRVLANDNIEILGYQNDQVLIDMMRSAKAFVFAAEEDFGIVPVEAQACGTPVIAFGKGGALETIQEGISGIFFEEQTAESICKAVHDFENRKGEFCPKLIRKNAEKFSNEGFRARLCEIIDGVINEK